MPLIDFMCKTCGETFQSFQRSSMSMDQGPSCPQCESENTVKAEISLDETSCEFAAGTGTGSIK